VTPYNPWLATVTFDGRTVLLVDFFLFFLSLLGWQTLPSHASAEACLSAGLMRNPREGSQGHIQKYGLGGGREGVGSRPLFSHFRPLPSSPLPVPSL